MNNEVKEIILNIRRLADQRAWDKIVEAADRLLSNQPLPNILIVAPAGVDHTAFYRWIEERMDAGVKVTISPRPLETFTEDPLPTLLVQKVLALFECGRLLNADIVKALASTFFVRPSNSYAVVFSGAENIEDEEDLDIIERSARRLLAPNQYTTSKEDLLKDQIFLWSANGAEGFLKDRLQRDKEALESWFSSPIISQAELEKYQILSLINFAEVLIALIPSVKETDDNDVLLKKLMETKEQLSRYSKRLVGRIESSLSSIKEQLIVSLQTVEQDSLHAIGKPLHDWFKQEASTMNEAKLERWVKEYITEEMTRWRNQTINQLTSRNKEMVKDTKELTIDIDWGLINETMVFYRETTGYPETIFEKIKFSELNLDKHESSLHPQLQTGKDLNTLFSTIVGFVVGSAMGAPLLPSPLPIATGALGAFGGRSIAQRRQREANFKESNDYAGASIKEVISQTIANVQEIMQKVIDQIPRHLSGEFQTLEKIMDKRIHEVEQTIKPENRAEEDRKILDDLRSKAAAMVI